MNRNRVLHLRASNFVGGPELQLLRYAQLECGGDWDLALGTFVSPHEGSDFLEGIEARGLKAIPLPASNLAISFHALLQSTRERQFDVICAHGYKADFLSLLVGRLTGTPVACFLRGWTGENAKVRLYESLDRRILRLADCIVCLSKSQASKTAARNKRLRKIRVVSNAIDTPRLNEDARVCARTELLRRFALPPDSRLVITGGRLSPEKGVSDFLRAVSMVDARLSTARFLVFGEGVLRQQLEATSQALGLQGRVQFVGFHRDLRSLLPGADLLVNPSHSEEMPNIVLEGMAAQIPVIATAVGCLEEVAGSERALCLVPPNAPGLLAREITRILGNPTQAKELAEAGRTRAEQAYSPSNQRSQFQNLYQELISSSMTKYAGSGRPHRAAGDGFPLCQPFADDRCPAPFLSIVMPVRNEARCIATVLTQLEAQEYPRDRFEILVVDGDSTDETRRVVEGFAEQASVPIKLLRNSEQHSSAGRNVGARNARGEFLIYIDGHCHISSSSLLRDAAELFEQTGADCLCRPQPLTLPGNSPFQDVVAHARATMLGHGWDSAIYTMGKEGPVNPMSAGALYRRSVFERVGYYNQTFDSCACEDVEFNYRVHKAGLFSYISPRLAVFYQPRSDLRALWQQMVRYGRGRCRLVREHPGAFSLTQIIPALMCIWIAVGTASSFFSWRIAELFLTTLTLYLGIVLVFCISLGLRYGWRHFVRAPTVYVAIHFGLGAGFLAEVCSVGDRARRHWRERSNFRSHGRSNSAEQHVTRTTVDISSNDQHG